VSWIDFFHSSPVTLIGAPRDSGVPRYIVVGGAGTLEVASGGRWWPRRISRRRTRQRPRKAGSSWTGCGQERELNWTFLSPSAQFDSGSRTGKFRLGTDQLLVDSAGKSWISFEDFAVAMADEIERPAHIRSRFTVGY
jgi:putative NADH-flavin reductase